jgi:hypothetical protein
LPRRACLPCYLNSTGMSSTSGPATARCSSNRRVTERDGHRPLGPLGLGLVAQGDLPVHLNTTFAGRRASSQLAEIIDGI